MGLRAKLPTVGGWGAGHRALGQELDCPVPQGRTAPLAGVVPLGWTQERERRIKPGTFAAYETC